MRNFQTATGYCLMLASLVLLICWFIVSPSVTNAYGLYNDYKDLPQLSGWMSLAYCWLDWWIEPIKDGKLEGWPFYAFIGQLSLFVYIGVSAWGGIYMMKQADNHVWPVAAIVAIAVWTSYLAVYIGYCFVFL